MGNADRGDKTGCHVADFLETVFTTPAARFLHNLPHFHIDEIVGVTLSVETCDVIELFLQIPAKFLDAHSILSWPNRED